MKILVIGSNPSNKSPDNTAFSPDTKSGKELRDLLSTILAGHELTYANVSNEKTPHNRPLSASEIRQNLERLRSSVSEYDFIVTVGTTATKAINLLKISTRRAYIPHISGRCRTWNNLDKLNYLTILLKAAIVAP